MKYRYTAFLAAFIGIGLLSSSCDLREQPKDQISEEEAYKSPQLIYLNTVASLYNEVGGDGWSQGLGGADRGLYDMNALSSDELIIPTRGGDWFDGGLWQEMFLHRWTVDNGIIKGTWDYLYRVVGKANMSLDKLNTLLRDFPDNKNLPIYIAEVRAFRAMYYSYLLDLYGNVPLVTKSTEKISDVKQSTRSEVYAFVVKELQESTPLLSEAHSANLGAYYGRMTQGVGYFLLAKLALNASVYADDNWADGSNDGTFAFSIDGKKLNPYEATIYYCNLIEKIGYTLEPDFSSNFSITNERSHENIFTIPMDPANYKAENQYLVRSRHYAEAKVYNQDGWNGASATKEVLAIFRKGGEDPRLQMTFSTGAVFSSDGKPVMDEGKPLVYKPDAVALVLSGSADEKTAGARFCKYAVDPNAQTAGRKVHNDYVLYRFADVLLMRSEALVRLGMNGDDDLNAVRSRVGAKPRTATLQTLLDERMLELAWEGHRRTDLIRFGRFNDAINDRPATDPHLRVFPIPAEVLNMNSNLHQNPKY